MTQIQYRKADGTLIETLTYAYDPNGQRVTKSSAGPLVPETPMSAHYDEANRMTSLTLNPGTDNAKTYQLTFDASGNLERKQNLNDLADTTIYTWDERDRLTAIQAPAMNATFAYDAMGRRVERTVNGETTKYFYEGMQALGEIKAGSQTQLLTGLMIDEMIARNTDQDQRTYLTDALGSVIAQAREDQSILNRYGYSPYGETTATASGEGNSSQYTGRENDGTGLYYYRARYYDPVLKRFISEDPIGLAGGVNTYAYVRGNPTSRTDPLGLKCDGFGCYTTPAEAAAANSGNYSAYYQLACAGGDAYACFAQHVAANDNWWGHRATNRVLDKLREKADASKQCLNESEILEQIRRDLAKAYADYLPNSSDKARWPNAQDIAQIHWKEFKKFGLPADTFGGSPFGQSGPLVIPDVWCPNCRP